ncbi:MAG: hypothetical protein CL758_01590 [Chloroflexi bacterium]|nr:hypothetical protein [Chloroflexota bacterium]
MVFKLMLVTDSQMLDNSNLVSTISDAVKGGLDAVQIREKEMSYKDLFNLTYEVKRKLGDQVSIFINGNPKIARELSIGLHLPAYYKNHYKLDGLIWGRSVHSINEVIKANQEGASYVILGTIFKTASKPNVMESGTNLIKEVLPVLGDMYLIAIGGINLLNVREVIEAGATGVAVRQSILESKDPGRTCEKFLELINKKE